MVKQLDKAVDDVVAVIVNSDDFKRCVELKRQMQDNKELRELVENIKGLQRKYVKTNDSSILNDLEVLEDKLNSIPIYVIYQQHLERVNGMISLVKDELNDYFYGVVNNFNI